MQNSCSVFFKKVPITFRIQQVLRPNTISTPSCEQLYVCSTFSFPSFSSFTLDHPHTMTTSHPNYTCLKQTSTLQQLAPAIESQPQSCIGHGKEPFLKIERLTLARAPNIEALILNQMEALQRKDPSHTCYDLTTSLKEFESGNEFQPQKHIVGGEEELKRRVLACKKIEICQLHLHNIKALTWKQIGALERNIPFAKQILCSSDTSRPANQASAEASVVAPADNSFSKSTPRGFALKCAFIRAQGDAGTCMFGPLALLFDQNKKQYMMFEHSRGPNETCRSFSFAADAICSSKFSDVEGNWTVLNLDNDRKTLYLAFKAHVDMLEFLTRIRW